MNPHGKLASVIFINAICSLSVTLGALPCPPTWQKRLGSEYHVKSDPMEWAKAREFCRGIGGDLLMPKSAEENTFANSLLEKEGVNRAWLNCHRDGAWLCIVNGVGQWPPFNNPDSLQPELDGNCLTMKAEDGKWRHTYCDGQASVVCERKATWRVSPVKYCMTAGTDGRLVTSSGQCVHDPNLM
ncbi:asialoglycoprotein receptor 2-like [Patiria miniata]|uniref:C-type lectin domain-containing protein n=1 Tax=Patiria miniata TaxID=46514 RepID=A0A914ASP6_PATMI|nr:asialoglycoprotein receptor 2-like [Patiria miniata]